MNATTYQNCTLDELERFYNSDPNDLDLCHAYIAKMQEENEDLVDPDDYYSADEYEELEKRVSELEDEIYELECKIAEYED